MSARLSRKEIKRDEVMEGVGSAFDFVREHARTVMIGLAVAALAGLAALFVLQQRSRAARHANELLAQAITVYQAQVDPTGARPDDPDNPSFADAAARTTAARQALERVREEGGGDAADIAAAYLGEIAAGEGDYERARELWEQFLERQSGHLLASQVRLNLFALSRAEGKGEQLVGELQAMIDQPEPPLPKEIALYELGQTLDRLGRTEEARDAYRRLSEEHPESPLSAEAESQAERLDGELSG